MTVPESPPEELSGPLAELLDERRAHLDEARPQAVERQRRRGAMTARERIHRLVEQDSFVEYGMLARPANPDLGGPADGIVVGVGTLRGRPVVVVAYDYTVLGGTQGHVSHLKIDRMFELAGEHGWPVVIFSEGGGARAQELGWGFGGGTTTFVTLAKLSGQVPLVAAVMGRAFAGHANLAGLCDFVVATTDATMGMAGPPLVEAALGERLTPEQIGPIEVHAAAGSVDLVVDGDAAAVDAVGAYLAYFEGPGDAVASAVPQESLRDLVPASPRRAYDVRKVVSGLADEGSVTELRQRAGRAVVTSLVRIGGRPVGVVANQPMVLAGAIDSAASDKIAHLIHLCDAFGLPVLCLVDTPGFMVGPKVEHTALVRHSARVIHALAHAKVPLLTVVLRKAYGLGYYAMGSPPFKPVLVLEWPTAEYGGMGLEGAATILNPAGGSAGGAGGDGDGDSGVGAAAVQQARADGARQLRDEHTARVAAAKFSVDDLVDPADTRDILVRTLGRLPTPEQCRSRRPIDPW